MKRLIALALLGSLVIALVAAASAMGSGGPGAAPTAKTEAPAAASASPSAEELDARRIEKVMRELKSTYRYLDDVTVTQGATPANHQAVAYHTEGRIVVSPDHIASIEDILAHEIWHVIDWRDNGRIDWAEDVPPANADAYRISAP